MSAYLIHFGQPFQKKEMSRFRVLGGGNDQQGGHLGKYTQDVMQCHLC